MTIKQLNYLVAIAEYQNISRAAEQLYISRSALNEFLLQLEQEIGTPLFTRVNKRMVPTSAGEKYLVAARRMLDINSQLYRELGDMRDDTVGRIRLSVNRSIGERLFRLVFPEFHKTYPRYTIELTATESVDVEKSLINGDIDLAITGYGFSRPVPAELEQISLGRCEIVLAIPKGYPLGDGLLFPEEDPPSQPASPIDLRLLKDAGFILLKKGSNARMVADECFYRAGFEPRIIMECSGGMIASQLVKDGLGPSILVETLVSNDPRVRIFSLDPVVYWMHSVSCRKGYIPSRAEKYFLELIKQQLVQD